MSGEDKRYLNGTRLSELWAKIKNYVTTQLGSYETKTNVAIIDQALTSAIGDIKASLGSAAYQDISIFASAEDYGKSCNDISILQGYFTNGSAKTAVQLLNARTLWGRSFNGTANISGDIENTGDITPSSDKAKNIGSDSLQYHYVYAGRYFTGAGAGMLFAASTGRYRWYDSTTLSADTLLMELRRSSGLAVNTDISSTGGVSALGIADLSIGGGGTSGTVTSITAGAGLTGGTITMTGTIALAAASANTIGGIKVGAGLSIDSNGVLSANEVTDSIVAGWGYKKGMVYTTGTPSDGSVQVATGANPTYQYITNTGSSIVLEVSRSGEASNSYGVLRYVMIYNNRNSATTVAFADDGQGVIGPADSVSIPANSYMEFRIIHPAANAKTMITWSAALKDISTL